MTGGFCSSAGFVARETGVGWDCAVFSTSVETELIACKTERPVVEAASFSAHGLATDAITGLTAGLTLS
ncbi:MAG: hypothetical protein KY393_03310 [Actinobacteria bacterium]|nr:hypothetical protein [Actinomycetota bacterium]